MVSRRRVLATAGVALTGSVAGCGADVFGSSNGRSFENWFGPGVLNLQNLVHSGVEEWSHFESATASHVADVAANDDVPEQLRDRLTLFTGFDDPVTSTHDAADVDMRLLPTEGSFGVDVGSFDVDAIAGALPDRASRIDSVAGNDAYAWTADPNDRDQRIGYAIGEERVVSTLGETDERLRENLEILLQTGAGEADRLVEVDEAASDFVDRLGDGHWTYVQFFGSDYQLGLRLRLAGETARRKTVFMYPNEAEAEESNWADPATVNRLRNASEDGEGTRTEGKFASYEEFDFTVDGRFVEYSGTLATESIGHDDLTAP